MRDKIIPKIGDVIIMKHQSPIAHFNYYMGIIINVNKNNFTIKDFSRDDERTFINDDETMVSILKVLANVGSIGEII